MNNLRFPLDFKFKIFTPSNDFSVFDTDGNEVAYTRQKIFKIKEAVEIFDNSSKNRRLFSIKADRIIDFNARYTVTDADNHTVGSIRREGVKSLWRTAYSLYDAGNTLRYTIREANPWIAVLDGLIQQIPVIGALSGYFLNPVYTVCTPDGTEHYRLKKQPSFFERKFRLYKTGNTAPQDDTLAVTASMMLMLLERSDG